MTVSLIICKLKVVRYARYEFINGLVHESKNAPKHEIIDQLFFMRGDRKKKYKVIIRTISKNIPEKFQINKILSFGTKNHEQYYDILGVYRDLDHNDENRRRNFLNRFSNRIYPSASWFTAHFLW